ncbi:serine/threonine protein kinase [Telmatocola sphagniphila]|uniref:Serine/threonine protein kinase n=1 Tax=Telmatocola sphagniphila TaxID=1123043 RepID=A0A8E6B9C6_9BACT|nr:serine/threonine-protein kinase [Telmatocola sphagniphila]QVL32780.1 serine/threonine protein kinase [Telmatocola sphagniphila]
MAAPATLDDLVKLIRKSGMVEEPRLDAYLDKLRTNGTMPTDVKKLAGSMVKDALITYFQAEQFMLGKWRGFTIGKYKLLERIGFGGMGQVFLCEHLYMKRRVAIKVLPPNKAEEPAALGRFYREARAAAALDHPNIVRTHDIDQDGNLHFLVMEYVDGSSLLEIVKKKGPMDVHRAINYTWQSVQALDHAFRVGVIHRDIKPGNILVDRFGMSKILDMGLARFYNTEDDMLTLKYDEKSVLGTADYVAPEQTVNSHDVDVRADIYSMGATFYFLLAGHPPFPDGTIANKLIAHQTKVPTPIRSIRPEVPEGVQAVLSKMMAKNINERYQTPAEVYEDLLPWISEQLIAPPEDELPSLSPAARESMGSSASISSTNLARQDSAILRADSSQRSGGLATLPPKQNVGGGSHAGTGGSDPNLSASNSAIRPPFFQPPPQPSSSGIGPSTISPPVSDPRGIGETKRMANSTEKTPQPSRVATRTPVSAQNPPSNPFVQPESKPGSGMLQIVAFIIFLFAVAIGVIWKFWNN